MSDLQQAVQQLERTGETQADAQRREEVHVQQVLKGFQKTGPPVSVAAYTL